MKTLLAIIFLSVSMHAQTAKVIALTPQETEEAQALDAEQKELIVRKAIFDENIRMKYLKESEPEGGRVIFFGQSGSNFFKKGWSFGEFEFSEDWKYIVPKTKTALSIPIWSGNNCTSFVAN